MSSYPEAQPRKDYYDVVDIYTLGSKKVAELSNGKLVFLTPEEYQQARRGIFQHYAQEEYAFAAQPWNERTCVSGGYSIYGRKVYFDCKQIGSLIGNKEFNGKRREVNKKNRPYTGDMFLRLGSSESKRPEINLVTKISQEQRPKGIQGWQGVFTQTNKELDDFYAAEKHPKGGYTLDQIIDSAAGVQGRETYGESLAYDHGRAEFESEPSYSLSAPLSQGVRPMSSKKMMMNGLAIGVAALIGFNFDRIVSMLRNGKGEDEQAAESMQSAANQGFMETWTGGNSGNPADDPRMEAKTMQGAVESEPQVKYNYQPFAGPSQVFHDEQTRQKNFFTY